MEDIITRRIHEFIPANQKKPQEDNYYFERMIEEELFHFLSSVIGECKPDIIIVVERKATAVFRALKELRLIDWPWSKVLSSAVLDEIDGFDEIDKSKTIDKKIKILVFDDMMRTGGHLAEVIMKLRKNFSIQPEQLDIAVYAVHQIRSDLIINCDRFDYPLTRWFYKNLDDDSYSSVRKRITNLLERTGSLLLDTEHIEIRLKPEYDFTELIQSLQISGKTISFNSFSNRKNITVHISETDEGGNLVNKILSDDLYPEGIIRENIVMKCRFIERPNGEIAILPICYPAVPYELEKNWGGEKEIIEIFGPQLSNTNDSVFYAVGLLAAVDVLSWVIKILAGTGYITESENEFVLPSINKLDFPGSAYTLNHLKAMYPFVDIKSITDRVNSCVLNSRRKGTQAKSNISKLKPNSFVVVDDSDLMNEAFFLSQNILFEILDQKFELYGDSLIENPHPFGLRTAEIYTIAEEMGVNSHQEISCLFDLMIDNAMIVTHVEKRHITHNGKTDLYRVRTFEIDGEVVTQQLMDYTDKYGLAPKYKK